MDNSFIEYLATQGIFAVFFGLLFLYVLRTSKKREEEYKKMIALQQENLPEIKKLLTILSKEK
ncbi:hypothetical protein JMA_35690 [Jeotgalibacillus malaysiensis]|uniref:Uncharacterized protein n=1 Tax=Jeotgalibacillus malaysiensis TaxID=1508404 RepID=A0A0B5AS45_9BACL|nr:BhlA/UviB family holin-like peptide [Jeotgalibacillus malaysiensis]AJD92886.1 hypothetical protein JMA_35690 [Jeotgalibacillus malaysiensis]